ncbi:MAG: quinone-modifying oxidoreductase, subunit QmoB [Bacteroidota bacterium]|nr:quinone-modifying oxidoreductase, subunit QmoB [Bacteroidota bacterium]
MADERKIGIYICSGCEIGNAVDCNKLAEDLKDSPNVKVCKVNSWLCGAKAVAEINNDIESEGLNRVSIAACSPRYLTDVFKFNHGTIFDRVNLREHVAWSHTPKEDETQSLAKDYIGMSLAKLDICEQPEPAILDINDSVMVVGGGAAGMNAALASAKAGYNVILVEKEDELGGFYKKLYKLTPRSEPYYDLEPNLCGELIAEVYSHPKIKVLTSTTILKTSGQPGMFDVTAEAGGETVEFQAGAIVQATGWKPYNPKKLGNLGYGKFTNVITNVQMEELAKEDRILKPSDGKPVKSVVFLQCAGSRDPEHLSYCSSVCCMTSLKQALYVKEKYPDAAIYIIYKDMRTPAQYEMFYKRVQSEDTIFLTKGELTGITENAAGDLLLDVDQTLIGEKIQIKADMVVLATGFVPSTLVSDDEDDTAQGETVLEGGKKAAAGAETGAHILNLTYRQGTDLPTLKYGFPDSHYICFPYETRRTGIYAAGTVRAPMNMDASKNDAYGAALKAIQCLESNRRGVAVHPRAGDMTYPDFFLQRCTQCKRCTEECPFGTLDEDAKGTPKPNLNRCRRCGICMGACPERIVSFKNYSVRMISQMIKSIEMPASDEEKFRMLAFMCENDAYPSLDIAGRRRVQFSPNIRVIPVRCLGSMNISWIADALSVGFDGVLLVGCKFGDDYQCHFIRGSELCNKRMENVQEKLKQLVLEPERVELQMLSIDEYDNLPGIINKFADTVINLGPNPYKDM